MEYILVVQYNPVLYVTWQSVNKQDKNTKKTIATKTEPNQAKLKPQKMWVQYRTDRSPTPDIAISTNGQ